jgi:hypothetical protein
MVVEGVEESKRSKRIGQKMGEETGRMEWGGRIDSGARRALPPLDGAG